jgi:epsilon-lactone hydrolase
MSQSQTRDQTLAQIAAIKALIENRFESEGRQLSLAEIRANYDAWGNALPLPEGATWEAITYQQVRVEKITCANSAPDSALIYLHGGGYGIGSALSHRHLVGQLCAASGLTGYNVDYRLAPETPFPGAVKDALSAYQGVIASGIAPEKIIIAGDSAGGGLTLATALAIKAAGLPQPAGYFPISPWANLTQSGGSYQVKAQADFIVTKPALDDWAKAYVAGGDARDPLVSPVYGDFDGIAPILIHVGSEEVLLSDATRVAEVAGLAGVDVTLVIAPDMPHVWHYMWSALGPAQTAIADAGAWMQARVGRTLV